MRGLPAVVVVLSWIAAGCGGAATPPPEPPPAPPDPGAGTDDADRGKTVQSPLELPCRVQARDVPGDEGEVRFVECPAGCAEGGGAVWGTDVYTDDSAVCPALIHAGVMPAEGGRARITFVDGQLSYPASTRNGVQSVSYPRWGRSFYAQSIDERGEPTSPVPEITGPGVARLSCNQRGSDLTGIADGVEVICPTDCAGVGAVWGTDVYTGDSAICSAAIHAGAIPPEGGRARMIPGAGQESFAGSERNGVTSQSYDAYGSSLTFEPLAP